MNGAPGHEPQLGRRFAAIDMGSNAIRLLFALVRESDEGLDVVKESLFRMPLRLGEDAFRLGRISPPTVERLMHTMHAFRHLVAAYGPEGFRACATSAMRRSANGPEIAARIREETGIDLRLIDGREEARIIFANHLATALPHDRPVLFVDVGGGSTELTVFSEGRAVDSRSFPIGTVRLLRGLVPDSDWAAMKTWLTDHARPVRPLQAVGSGGNINKIFNMSGVKKGRPLSRARIRKVSRTIEPLSMADRVHTLGLRPDRADVIVHAARIYGSVMLWAKTDGMLVPQFGLADGLVREMARG